MVIIIGVTPGTCHHVGGSNGVALTVIGNSLLCTGGAASDSRTFVAVSNSPMPRQTPIPELPTRTNLHAPAIDREQPRRGSSCTRANSRPHIELRRPRGRKDFLHRMALPFGVSLQTERPEHRRSCIQNRHRLVNDFSCFNAGPPGNPGHVRQTSTVPTGFCCPVPVEGGDQDCRSFQEPQLSIEFQNGTDC